MRSIALVGMNGCIDFLCYPEFDSPTVFAALLDDKRGGCFRIQPKFRHHRVRQLYIPNTNILLKRFLSEEGVAEVLDYMPIGIRKEQPNEIVRQVTVIRGKVEFDMLCQPRFNYAKSKHRVEKQDGFTTFTPESDECPPMALYSSVEVTEKAADVYAEFTLRANEKAVFVLGEVRPQNEPPEIETLDRRFRETSRFWKTWAAKSNYKGRWRETINRSALMLKLLISRKHGSLIASPTFSLPEHIGGVRNWDYRYTWLRDATFTLYSLIRLGYVEETESFIEWLNHRLADDAERGPLQVMYSIDGTQKLEETELENLCGYENSHPVRIGNAAFQQLQLDIYGEMMDSIYLANKYGHSISYAGWENVQRILAWLQKNWERPDEGIWEVRGGPREFLHSRLMDRVSLPFIRSLLKSG